MIVHKCKKKWRGYFVFLCNEDITGNESRVSDDWEEVTCDVCLKLKSSLRL